MILTTRSGKEVIVDDEFLMPKDMSLSVTSHGYAVLVKSTGVRTEKGWYKYKRTYLHRYVMDNPVGYQVDHINMNRLDNRKSNLRKCTNQENNMNKKPTKGKYKGVYFSKDAKKWIAQISKNGKCVSIGSYLNEVEAAKAYNEAAKERFGVFAYLNPV